MSDVFNYLYKSDPLLKLVECGVQDGQFYRLYSDGYCLQGASRTGGANCFPTGTQITFLKPYKDTNYGIIGYGFIIASYGECAATNVKTTGFTMTQIGGRTAQTQSWLTVGWCDMSEYSYNT